MAPFGFILNRSQHSSNITLKRVLWPLEEPAKNSLNSLHLGQSIFAVAPAYEDSQLKLFPLGVFLILYMTSWILFINWYGPFQEQSSSGKKLLNTTSNCSLLLSLALLIIYGFSRWRRSYFAWSSSANSSIGLQQIEQTVTDFSIQLLNHWYSSRLLIHFVNPPPEENPSFTFHNCSW